MAEGDRRATGGRDGSFRGSAISSIASFQHYTGTVFISCFCRTPTRSDHEVRLSSPPTTTTLSSEIEICTSDSPTPPNPYIFWKLVTRAIQRRQRDTNTKTMTITNTKTKTKTKTKRLKAALPTVPRPQTHTFSESSCQELFKDGNVTQIQRQWQLQIRRRRQRQRRGRQDNTWNTYSVLYFRNPDDSPSPAQHCPEQSSKVFKCVQTCST